MKSIRTNRVITSLNEGNRPTNTARYIGALFIIVLLACAASALGQSDGSSSAQAAAALVPPPDPGYSLYYHDSPSAPEFAARWGYHDGWTEGRHDRNHGDVLNAQDKEHFETPPDRGPHPGMTHEQYAKEYRTAYVHGYEHGSRI